MFFVLWLLVLIAVAATVSAVVTTSILRGRSDPALGAPDAAAQERLRRLEAAVESLAAEMERMSEGQRFLTEVLAERRGTRLPPPEEQQ